MTRNDTPDKLEWSICPRSGVDSAQWDWGIRVKELHSSMHCIRIKTLLLHALCQGKMAPLLHVLCQDKDCIALRTVSG